jgi:DNA repair photolyase
LESRRLRRDVETSQDSMGESTSKNLLYLRSRDTAETEGLQRMSSKYSSGQRLDESRATYWDERYPQVRRNATQDERSGFDSSRRNVDTRQWPKISRVETSAGRTRESRYLWLSAVKATSLYVPVGACIQHAVDLGSSYRSLVRPKELRLDLRTVGDSTPQRSFLPSRLSIERRANPRNQRISRSAWNGESGTSAQSWISHSSVEPEETPTVGSVRVETITYLGTVGVWVYDIETTTQNFYQRGVLVHNCYVNSGSRGWRGSGLITVPLDFGRHVAKQLDSMKVSAAGYFSSFTDPFLPLEEYYHNTQRGAEAFINRNLPIFFLSRLSYPGWAYDLLSKNTFSYAQKSINTPSEEVWKRISPGAISLAQHFEEIKELRRRGIYVSIQCNPVIPGIVSHGDIEALFEMLARAGTNHVIVKFVEAGHAWARTMVERIGKKFPDERAARFAELFTENQAGGQKTIQEEYRREGHARYQKKATELGMTYSLCYEYTNKSGRWRSMGPEFLTSAQCHGHAVPIFENRGDHYEPLDVCPPSGCLRCEETHPGEAMCGSEILKQAKALRLPDLRNPWKKPTIPLRPV